MSEVGTPPPHNPEKPHLLVDSINNNNISISNIVFILNLMCKNINHTFCIIVTTQNMLIIGTDFEGLFAGITTVLISQNSNMRYSQYYIFHHRNLLSFFIFGEASATPQRAYYRVVEFQSQNSGYKIARLCSFFT